MTMEALVIAHQTVQPGTTVHTELPFARLPTGTSLPLPLVLVHGVAPGPTLWLSAAIHGDEVNGIEIIHQVLSAIDPTRLNGSVVAVPVVNVFGFVQQSRYLPDRRDLNRSFPGSPKGSTAARLAHLFMETVVSRCTHGIDLHTGSHHRVNLPQIRANLRDPETLACAQAFATPLIIHAESRDGSLRQAAQQRGIPCLLLEAGEANRFDRESIAWGVTGILRVMAHLGMQGQSDATSASPRIVWETTWIRARRGGIFRCHVELGQELTPGQRLGEIVDTIGQHATTIRARQAGVVIGLTLSALVHRGDGLINLARI